MTSNGLILNNKYHPDQKAEKYFGLLLGAITGDCLGLPVEMLSSLQKIQMYGQEIRHAFISIPWCGRFGICSDDTEHILMTADALCKTTGHNPDLFGQELSHRLKRWLLTIPISLGRATLLSGIKLLLGKHYTKSGVFSAGNGAAIRALIIGAFYFDNMKFGLEAVKISTQITHTDPRAIEGSVVMAYAAALAMRTEYGCYPGAAFFDCLLPRIKGNELRHALYVAKEHLSLNLSLADYLNELAIVKTGISGYINHTVPSVIYAWLRYYGDYRETVSKLIAAGGDTDTTAALAGALSGLTVGPSGIPQDWLDGVWGWPITFKTLHQMSHALSDPKITGASPPSNILFLVRNVLTFPIFLIHIIRRIIRI